MFNSVVNMSYKKCCVPGCPGTENVLHQFPNPSKHLDLFIKWLNCVGGDAWNLSNEFIYKNRRVCRIHFETKHQCRNNRLSNVAVPTINMPWVSSKDTLSDDIVDIPKEPLSTPASDVYFNEQVTVLQPPRQPSNITYATPTSISGVSFNEKFTVPKLPMQPSNNTPTTTPTSRSDTIKYTSVIEKQEMLKTIKKLETTKILCEQRLKKQRKLATNTCFQKALAKFKGIAGIFMKIQFREIMKPKSGRRFTKEEKIMALSLYKTEPEVYRWFVKSGFILPSPITFNRLIAEAT